MRKYPFILAMALLYGSSAWALETPAAFKIDKVFVSQPNNFHFRVKTSANVPLCAGGPSTPGWAYINEADPGSRTMIASLLSAFAAGKTVQLYTTGVFVGAAKYCQILEFDVIN